MSSSDHAITAEIAEKTAAANQDNITRTLAYQQFYLKHKEIKWAFLASMVSRNAGWNMTDLKLPCFQMILSQRIRKQLFSLYERANWLIFSDAYPQLLLYEKVKQRKLQDWNILQHFHVSVFMIQEWEQFMMKSDEERLLASLIVNEQNVIEQPVVQQHFYNKQVFHNWPYLLQDILRLNAVFFPTESGHLYGQYAHHFTSLDNRIEIGKKLGGLLFSKPLYNQFLSFAVSVYPTGSRQDYEQFCRFSTAQSPELRSCYPIITHKDSIRKDWGLIGGVKEDWFDPVSSDKLLTKTGLFFYQKRRVMEWLTHPFIRKSKVPL